jgi:hypothetical protein
MGEKVRREKARTRVPLIFFWVLFAALFAAAFYYAFVWALTNEDTTYVRGMVIKHAPPPPQLDKLAYNVRMLRVAGYAIATTSTSTVFELEHMIASSSASWPVKNLPYPKVGALLPFYRIVAYYGNFYSRGMGVLGQYDPPQMLERLRAAVDEWHKADPSTPVMPAIHYIVQTAQESPQKDGTYRLQMPDDQIDKALALAEEVHGVVFIDFQVGFSTVQKDLPAYEAYLRKPNVHVGIDPEFSMKGKYPPGREIGMFDATDVNWVAEYLAKLVKENNLPPKVLVVHRFTRDMLTRAAQIAPLPEVQIVIDMDGWGDKAKKRTTYDKIVAAEPVQFTGFKLFYKNDMLPPSTGMFTPQELLQLTPKPIYIQYQ